MKVIGITAKEFVTLLDESHSQFLRNADKFGVIKANHYKIINSNILLIIEKQVWTGEDDKDRLVIVATLFCRDKRVGLVLNSGFMRDIDSIFIEGLKGLPTLSGFDRYEKNEETGTVSLFKNDRTEIILTATGPVAGTLLSVEDLEEKIRESELARLKGVLGEIKQDGKGLGQWIFNSIAGYEAYEFDIPEEDYYRIVEGKFISEVGEIELLRLTRII